jgi:tetratricopeptide (TPR) repeat protein
MTEASGPPPQGRAAQLETIRRALAAAENGSTVSVLVEGEPGIGRSAVLADMSGFARERGFTVVHCGCDPHEQRREYVVLRRLLVAADDRFAADDRLSGRAQTDLRERFECAVESTGLGAPLLLVVDDLQWCDGPTLRSLSRQLRRSRRDGLMLLAAVRSGEPADDPEPLADLAAHCLRAQLVGLGEDRIGELVEATLTGYCDPSFVTAVARATDGNPRLVRALLDELAACSATPDRRTAARLSLFAPESASDDAYVRMRGLDPDTAAVAEAVAVLEGHAELPAAARIAGLSLETATAAADLLVHCRLLRNQQPLAFRHGLVAAAIVRFLPVGRAETLHSRAAAYLREARAEEADVAHHLMRTSPSGEPWAGDVLHVTGLVALAEGRRQAAVAYLRRALREPREPRQRARVLADLGLAECQLDVGSASEHLNRAVRDVPDPAGHADIAGNLAGALLARRRAGEARAMLDHSARRLAGAGGGGLAVRLEAQAMATAVIELSSARELGRRADRLAGRTWQDEIAQRNLDTVKAAQECRLGGRAQTAFSLARGVLAKGAPVELTDLIPFWINVVTLSRVEEDDLAQHHCDQGEAVAERRDDQLGLAIAFRVRCRLAYQAGRLGEAVQAANRAGALLKQVGADEGGYGWLHDQTLGFHALIESGRTEEAAHLMGIDPADPARRAPSIREYGFAHGHLLLARGNPAAAKTALLGYGRLLEGHGVRGASFSAWRYWAVQALVAVGDIEEAQQLATQAVELARSWDRPRALGIALHAAAVAATATGAVGSDGLSTFEEARSVLAGTTSRLVLARMVTDHGIALRAAGLVAEAESKLREAVSLAHECGAQPLAARAAGELEAAIAASRHTLAPVRATVRAESTAMREMDHVRSAGTGTGSGSGSGSGTDANRLALRIRCFGGFRMRSGDVELDCSAIRPKVRSLLQLLAVNAARPVHREQLLEALWPDLGPQAGIRNLQVTVSQLRAFLEPETGRGSRHLLLRDGESYQISLLPQDVCDVREFERARPPMRLYWSKRFGQRRAGTAVTCCRNSARPSGWWASVDGCACWHRTWPGRWPGSSSAWAAPTRPRKRLAGAWNSTNIRIRHGGC